VLLFAVLCAYLEEKLAWNIKPEDINSRLELSLMAKEKIPF
jgi:hypothetical protein